PPKLSAFPTTLSLSLPPTPMVKISVDIRFRSYTPEIRQESGTGGSKTTVSREPGPRRRLCLPLRLRPELR
ncbi:unnamed protein product, partial [Musa hybrid cultivar]